MVVNEKSSVRMQANAAPDLLTRFENGDAEDPREILYGHRPIILPDTREYIPGAIMLQKGRSLGIGQLCISVQRDSPGSESQGRRKSLRRVAFVHRL